MAEPRNIVCPHCTATNRLPRDRDAKKAKCGRCKNMLFDGHPHSVNTEQFDKHITRNDIPVVVDFWADWCAPCKMMEPAYAAVAAEMEPNLRFLKVDTEAEQALAARYAIRSIPMLMVFRKGSILAQRAGAVDRKTLRAWLEQMAMSGAA